MTTEEPKEHPLGESLSGNNQSCHCLFVMLNKHILDTDL